MKDLIEALTIFAKYQKDTRWPTFCDHDILIIMGVGKDVVSVEDQARLEKLDFKWDDREQNWYSFRFGSS
jgi:hypothetical protein